MDLEGISVNRIADAKPYPWPWNETDPRTDWAMLTVESDGSPIRSDTAAAIETVRSAITAAGVPEYRVRVQSPHAPGTRLDHTADPRTVTAAGWDGFAGSDLDRLLRQDRRTTLVIVGRWLEVGVHSTLRSANDRGYECALVADACSAWDETLRPASLSTIEMSGGIFGAVTTCDAVTDLFSRRTSP
jgi:nicotinamidase-related amidase